MNKKLAILLATYNGERYLQEQIDSLFKQTYKDWVLYIHDDGSTDATPRIISDNAKMHDNIVVMEHAGGHGAKENFFGMLRRVEADYYMFCDQDDVWLENKVELSMERMQELENRINNSNVPIIVHSDLFVVDERLNVVNDSFWRFVGINPDYLTKFERLSAVSLATGCTMLINNKAKTTAFGFPYDKACMHDAWITACTMKAGGIVSGIRTPLTYYRQHSDNCIGASEAHPFNIVFLFRHIKELYKSNMKTSRMFKSLGCPLHVYLYNKIMYRIKNKRLN